MVAFQRVENAWRIAVELPLPDLRVRRLLPTLGWAGLFSTIMQVLKA